MDKTAKKNKEKRRQKRQAEIEEEKNRLFAEYNERIKTSKFAKNHLAELKRSPDELYRAKYKILNDIKIEVSIVAIASLFIHLHDCYQFGKKRLTKLFNYMWSYGDIIKKDVSRLKMINDEIRFDYNINLVERMKFKPLQEIPQLKREAVTLRLYELTHILPIMIYPLISKFRFGKRRISGIVYGVKQRMVDFVLNGKMKQISEELLVKTGIKIDLNGDIILSE